MSEYTGDVSEGEVVAAPVPPAESRLKSFGSTALGFLFIGGLMGVFVLVIFGLVWAAEHLLPWLVLAAMLAIAVDILVLLPLSIVRPLRGFTGGTLVASSFLIGLTTWLAGFILTGALWGGFALFVGLFLFGVGVVPMAMLATLFKGMWFDFFSLLVMVVMTFGTRVAGLAISGSRER